MFGLLLVRGRVRCHLVDESTFEGVLVKRGRYLVLADAHVLTAAGGDVQKVPMGEAWIPRNKVRVIERVAK